MFKQLLAVIVACLMVNLLCVAADGAKGQAHREPKAVEKIRTKVARMGGVSIRVRVTLLDETRVNGYLKQVAEDAFTIVDGAGTTHTIAFNQVKDIKQIGEGGKLSKAAKLASIAAGVTAALFIFGFIFQGY